MAYGLTPDAINEYVPRSDRDLPPSDPKRTVFRFRLPTQPERAAMEDAVSVGQGRVIYLTLKSCLVGWEQYLDAKNTEIPFVQEGKLVNVCGKKIDPPSDATLDCLSQDHRYEIVNAIHEAMRVSPEQEKN